MLNFDDLNNLQLGFCKLAYFPRRHLACFSPCTTLSGFHILSFYFPCKVCNCHGNVLLQLVLFLFVILSLFLLLTCRWFGVCTEIVLFGFGTHIRSNLFCLPILPLMLVHGAKSSFSELLFDTLFSS